MTCGRGAGERDSELDRLSRQYPRWLIWRGRTTGSYWALPPRDHPFQRDLIGASDLDELAWRLAQAERWQDLLILRCGPARAVEQADVAGAVPPSAAVPIRSCRYPAAAGFRAVSARPGDGRRPRAHRCPLPEAAGPWCPSTFGATPPRPVWQRVRVSVARRTEIIG